MDDTSANSDNADNASQGRPASYLMEGYTPLNVDMNALIGMIDSDDDGNSDAVGYGHIARHDVDEDAAEADGDPFAGAGYYHVVGVPPRRLNGVKNKFDPGLASMPNPDRDEESALDHHMNDSDGEDTDVFSYTQHGQGGAASSSPTESVSVPDDFHRLAEQALRGLEVEHLSTLEGAIEVQVNGVLADSATDTTAATPTNDQSTNFEASFPTFGDNDTETNIAQAQASVKRRPSDDFAKIEPTVNIPTLRPTKPSEVKPMDVNAIQKAMQSIRLKSPQLATTLDAGASSCGYVMSGTRGIV